MSSEVGQEAGYPVFSAHEMHRRREALHQVVREAEVDRVLLYGADRSGSSVQWLTGWPVTREAVVVHEPGEPPALFVQFFNHVPLATELALEAQVSWGGSSTIETVCEELRTRGGHGQRLGVIGPLPFTAAAQLRTIAADLVDLGPAYTRLRLVKSAEELTWLRRGAELSDAAVAALEAGLRSGLTEWELADMVERAYVPHGGTTHIHYFGVTAMHEPRRCVPAQFPSARRVRGGDAVVTEISASFWGYPGQVLRTFAVEEEPPQLYRELHEVADAAFAAMLGALRDGASTADVLAAAAVVEDAGFTTCDDLLHGFGGGYLPPVLSAPARPGPKPRPQPLTAGMTVVVQPNVTTVDGRAGVQTGELVVITEEGAESLHRAPRGLRRVGVAGVTR